MASKPAGSCYHNHMHPIRTILCYWWLAGLVMTLTACNERPWNDPYPAADETKNIFYSSFEERPKHLDPVRSYSANEYEFIAQIYEPPLQYHFLKRPYELIPLTATQLPKPVYLDQTGNQLPASAPIEQIANSVYRLAIRPGIQYQAHPCFARTPDGKYRYHDLTPSALKDIHVLADFRETDTRELTAADYVYQIKRLANPKLHSPIAGVMAEYIDGFAEFTATLAKVKHRGFFDLNAYELAGAKVIDRYTYELKLKGKYPQILYWLAMSFFAPMPWEAEAFYSQPGMQERNITLDWYPVGTGPFILTENNPNRRMVLTRNPHFRGETYPDEGEAGDRELGFLADAGKRLPLIDQAVFSLEKETIPYWNKFLQGYYDTSGVSSDSFDQAVKMTAAGEARLTEDMQAKSIHLLTAVTTTSSYMGFNMLDEVVGGDSDRARKLRQAIAIAVDYEELISIFANGRGIAAQGPLPPGIFGYKEGEDGINPYVYRWVNGRPERRTIAEASHLLAAAGYPDGQDSATGKPLVLYFDTPTTGPDAKSRLDWLRKQFAKLNLQLVVRDSDYNRFQEKMLKGTAQIYEWGWNADYPDPENFFFLLYGPNAKVEYLGENASNYRNPVFDSLFNQMKNMDNSPERQVIIDKMTEIVRQDSPWIWGLHPVSYALYHDWYGNAKPNLIANNTLKYKRIDPVRRREQQFAWNQPVLWPVALLTVFFLLSLMPALITYRRKEKAVGVV